MTNQSNPRSETKSRRSAAPKSGKAKTTKATAKATGNGKTAPKFAHAIEAFTDVEIFAQFGGGHRDNRGLLLPGPGHDKDDASMRLFVGPFLKDGFRTHSFAGDAPEKCRQYVLETLGLKSRRRRSLSPEEEAESAKKIKEIDEALTAEKAVRFAWWHRRWKRAWPMSAGDNDLKWVAGEGNTNCAALGVKYFEDHRGVPILDNTVFRWNAGIKFTSSGEIRPSSIMARIMDWNCWDGPRDENVVGYHETFIDDFDGSPRTIEMPRGDGLCNHEKRLSHCSNKGIIWLSLGEPRVTVFHHEGFADWEVRKPPEAICFAEGIENALAFGLLPEANGAAVVSFVSAYNLDALPLPPHKIIYLAVDIEKSGIGKEKAEAFARRAAKEGKLVRLVYPNIPLDAKGKADLNDVIRVEGFKVDKHYKIVDVSLQAAPDARTPGGAGGARIQFGDYVSYDDYDMSEHGLFMLLRNNQGVVWGRTRLSAAFKIIGSCRDVNNKEWGTLLEFSDPDGNVKREHFTNADMHNVADIVTGRLASAGLVIMPHQKNLVRDYIGGVTVANRIRSVARTGWSDECDAFVLPDETIGDIGGEQPLLINAGAHRYAHHGSLEDWKNSVAKLAEPHRLSRLAISTALSGPLLALVNGESGGLHFVAFSCKGKTSGLLCPAASVWGKGSVEGGYIKTWNSTANALEGSAAMASDALLPLDELSEANSAEVEKPAYMFANQQGKERMRADTSQRAARTWRIAVLSTGEKTIAQKIAENFGKKAPAGIEVRIVNINADAGHGHGVFENSRRLRQRRRAGWKVQAAIDDILWRGWPGFRARHRRARRQGGWREGEGNDRGLRQGACSKRRQRAGAAGGASAWRHRDGWRAGD